MLREPQEFSNGKIELKSHMESSLLNYLHVCGLISVPGNRIIGRSAFVDGSDGCREFYRELYHLGRFIMCF